jgi:outer membrane biosynthesis protein TonB
MTLQLHIEAEKPEDLKSWIAFLSGLVAAAEKPKAAASASEPAAETEEPKEDDEPKTETKRRGRPPKSEQKTEPAPEEEAGEEQPKPANADGMEAVRTRLKRVLDEVSPHAMKGILARTGHSKVSELPVESYPDVIASADAILGQAEAVKQLVLDATKTGKDTAEQQLAGIRATRDWLGEQLGDE